MRPTKHASALLQCAYKLYSEGKMCDTTLQVEGHTLNVHRLVLVAYSSFFDVQGKGNLDYTLSLDGLELKFTCVNVLINYMYTGVLEAGECALNDLQKAAASLQMTEAQNILTELQKNNIKTEEAKPEEDEAILSSNDESLNVKEEPDSDYDYEKETAKNRSHSRGKRSVTVKRTASRRSSRTQKEVKIPKIQALPRPRSRRKGKPEKIENLKVKEEKDETKEVQEEDKEKRVETVAIGENEREKCDKSFEKNQSPELTYNPPESPKGESSKARIIKTAPRPIKPYKQGDGNYKCPEENCDFMTISDKAFKRHWRQHTGEKPYKCSECDKEFSDLKYIYEHLPTHSDETPYGCSKCNKKFKTKKNLSRHFSNHHKEDVQTFTCVMCNGKFNSKYGLHTHERSVHGLKPSTVCDFPDCGYTAPTPSELKKHQVKHIPREERAKIMCDICGSLFVSPKCLRSHLRFMHYGEPQKCPFCQYTTPAKHLLMGHCARVHKCTLDGVAVEPKFFCNMCDFKCYHKHEYKCHLLKHADDLPHKCTFCTFATHMKGTLVKHLRTHTKERPFSCKICGKTFTNHSSLAMHNRSHLGIKPHKCKLCDKAFASSSTLKEHMFSHQNISPFMCHICCYGCVRKNILRKHIVTKHGPDALPPDMVFKRGYPLLEGVPKEMEDQEAEMTFQVQTRPQITSGQQQQQPGMAVQPPSIITEPPITMETPQQNVPASSANIITGSVDTAFNDTGLSSPASLQATAKTQGSHNPTQQLPVVGLNRSHSRENAQPILTLENANSTQVHTSLDSSTSSHPAVANPMSGHLYGLIRHNQSEQPLPVSTQADETLPATHQTMPPLFSHSQQPVGNQPGYTEYPGYLSSSQMSLIQQMYLQSYNTSNVPQQQQ